MNNGYLWDPSQKPDPAIEQVEQALQPLAYKPNLAALEQKLAAPEIRVEPRPRLREWAWMGLAASILVAVAGAITWNAQTSQPAGWKIASLEGTVQVGASPIRGGSLAEGQTLATSDLARAQLEVGLIGSVEVQSNSVVRLVKAQASQQRMALQRGSIRAVISAPPRLFIVETPSAVAVDLGCAYKLDVNDAGSGFLQVTVGWVSFEALGRESFIPAGAACRTRKGWPPGTPFYRDASEAFQTALETVDFAAAREERLAARRIVLSEARTRDALTLWHLLNRGNDVERALTYDRLAQLISIPEGVTREGVLSLDRAMLDKLWNALDLGPTTWWRLWRGPAPPSP